MSHRSIVVAIGMFSLFLAGVSAEDKPKGPGPTTQGFLLPNGWTITPAGRQVALTDLPLNILPLADNKHVLVAASGYNKHELTLIELKSGRIVDKQTVLQSWFGLAMTPDEKRLWWSGGGAGMLHNYELNDLKLKRIGANEPPLPKRDEKSTGPKDPTFKSGLLHDSGTHTLYSLDINKGTITALDLESEETRTAKCGGRPYDVVRGRNGAQLYVSDWAGRSVLAIDPKSLRVTARIPVGEHPNQMIVHPKDDRLFVACASSNCVSVLDTRRGVVAEKIVTSLFPRAPEGSTPDALALSPNGETLYVANADNNCVAVIDVAAPGKSALKGFLPTGWYPTAIAVAPDGKTLLVGVGKGNQTHANPIDQDTKYDKTIPDYRRLPFPYIGTTLSGALSIVPVPNDGQLAKYTATVYRNCPYSDKLPTASPHPDKTIISSKPGEPSPIKYVLYIIKENRTYDQVFGDIKEGNGDPSLVMFGEKITPNHHKLARDFVLLDNLYCNGQVSRDGHPWSTMAYGTDYISRDWHLTYSNRKGVDDDEEGHLSNAPSGYLWDACARAGLSYRSYGEYGKQVSSGDGARKMEGRVPGLVGHICPEYGVAKIKGKRLRDTENAETFLKEYRQFEKEDKMPRFIVMSLGEDHTTGTTPHTYTPQACVASNDLALGRIVEAVTRSKYWKETAIFVIEDDAQNGPDHVDAHRTVGLIISPYTK
ncbi:MAG: beta-propeller fold lactonase family protein, partial [Gemmataceae bacterium]